MEEITPFTFSIPTDIRSLNKSKVSSKIEAVVTLLKSITGKTLLFLRNDHIMAKLSLRLNEENISHISMSTTTAATAIQKIRNKTSFHVKC